MMLGCGYCEKTIHRRPYLYFWHYESHDGRREQFEEYVGPARSLRAREAVARKVSTYAERACAEMSEFVRETRAEMASAYSG